LRSTRGGSDAIPHYLEQLIQLIAQVLTQPLLRSCSGVIREESFVVTSESVELLMNYTNAMIDQMMASREILLEIPEIV